MLESGFGPLAVAESPVRMGLTVAEDMHVAQRVSLLSLGPFNGWISSPVPKPSDGFLDLAALGYRVHRGIWTPTIHCGSAGPAGLCQTRCDTGGAHGLYERLGLSDARPAAFACHLVEAGSPFEGSCSNG